MGLIGGGGHPPSTPEEQELHREAQRLTHAAQHGVGPDGEVVNLSPIVIEGEVKLPAEHSPGKERL